MRLLIFLILFTITIAAQSEKELFKNELSTYPDSEILMESDSLIKYRIGEIVSFFEFGEPLPTPPKNSPYPVLEFDMLQYDTADYSYLYNHIQTIRGCNDLKPTISGDLNRNGKVEIYLPVYTGIYPQYSLVVYEKDAAGRYSGLYEYPPSVYQVVAAYDITGDGREELHIVRIDSTHNPNVNPTYHLHQIYTNNDVVGFPTDTLYEMSSFFSSDSSMPPLQNFVYGDFNKNGISDVIYTREMRPLQINWGEYNPYKRNLYSLFKDGHSVTQKSFDLSVGDYDNDGREDFVLTTSDSHWYVFERVGTDKFVIADSGVFEAVNAKYTAATKDMDGNGKPEFWIGGYSWTNTKLVCFEASGDNTYERVAEIYFRNFVNAISDPFLTACDINNDGREELAITGGRNIVILSFAGEAGNPGYKILYYQIASDIVRSFGFFNEPEYEYPSYAIGYKYRNPLRDSTDIYRYHQSTDIGDNIDEQREVTLSTYPNPFNSECSIKFTLPEYSQVKITIYNSLGQQIGDIVNQPYEKGEHTLRLPMESLGGGGLSTGIYFLSLETCRQRIINKILYLK